jgi:hypothetical protein
VVGVNVEGAHLAIHGTLLPMLSPSLWQFLAVVALWLLVVVATTLLVMAVVIGVAVLVVSWLLWS